MTGARIGASAVLCAALATSPGCRNGTTPPTPPAVPPSTAPAKSPVQFTDVALPLGVDFQLGNGGRSPLTILDTAGGGCAFLDYDGDGWPDLLFVGRGHVSLYRNLLGKRFQRVPIPGLNESQEWMGCAVGDYNGDGRPDILLTGYRCLALLRNLGDGGWKDETAAAGLRVLPWSISAAFADVNGDGTPDLYIGQYLRFDQSTPQVCRLGNIESACGPEVYEPLHGSLYLNRGGRFVAAPKSAPDTGKTWGVMISSLLGEGQPSIYLANDMLPCDLLAFGPDGVQNRGPSSGTAYDGQGHLVGAMGIEVGDYDNDGDFDLVVSTFFTQPKLVFRNDGNGLFTVRSSQLGIGGRTTPFVAFGTALADFDNDGWLDLMFANGHVRDNVSRFDSAQSYAQPTLLFRNRRGQAFEDVSESSGDILRKPIVGRGLAVGDFDRDGRLDVAICDREGHAQLLHNESPGPPGITIRLDQPGPNRSAIGAILRVSGGGTTQSREIRTCGSVMSAIEPSAHFARLQGRLTLSVRWPDGATESADLPDGATELAIRRGGAKMTLAVTRSGAAPVSPDRSLR